MEVHSTEIGVGHIKPRWLSDQAATDIIVPPEARIQEPITILHLSGKLDGSGYETMVSAAQAEYENGARRMILDLEGVPSVSSAGVIGLYIVGAMLGGENLAGLEGYAVMAQMRAAIDAGELLAAMCLAAPGEKVASALERSGFARLVRIMPTVDDAISDFPEG
jgi:anti-anti-sigma regulatory factor